MQEFDINMKTAAHNGNSKNKVKMRRVFIFSMTVFILCGLLCFFNTGVFYMKPFQQTTYLSEPAMAKFEKDGNLYIIDSGSFRLICMDTDGNVLYMINIDKMKEYTRIVDGAIDELGNLYVYAIEAEYDAFLTKRDIIRKYDNQGRFVKDIVSINYGETDKNSHMVYQFGSFRCENGILTFSRIEQDKVTLYQYDTFRDICQESVFTGFLTENDDDEIYLVAQLVLKDMQNFAYVMRDGDIFEVRNGGESFLVYSFNWTETEGGIIPWYIQYDALGNIVFFDMASNNLFRITSAGLFPIVPQIYFDPLVERGETPLLRGFGFYDNVYAGVFGSIAWLYDGSNFFTYDDELLLPLYDRAVIMIVQLSLVIGIIAFIIGIIVLFVGILNRYISLFIKQTAVIIPLLIAAFIILFSTTFNIMSQRLYDTLENEMMVLASIASKMINGDDVDSLTSIKDVRSDTYKNLLRTLREITGNNADPWNKGYYASLFKGPYLEYCAVISNEEMSLFRPSMQLDEESYEILLSGKPIGGIFSLNDGDWAYAATPVFNSAGDLSCMFEIGLDMIAYEVSNAKLKREVAFIATVICLIILVALSVLISIVVRQLSTIVKVLSAIAGGNRSERVRYKAHDELGKVSQGLNNMAEELHIQFDRINRLNESTIRFVPMQFMDQLGVSDISKMKLGDNVQREMTVLFFDIRAFSINSEMMTAHENFVFINNVLGITGPIIRKHKGFIDKYIGDAAMALFDNGLDAVRAGIELYQKVVLDTEARVKIGADGINIGIGIHTGSVMMGIVGENERLSSTVISANVNLASRVESLSKQTGSGLLITRDTLNKLAGYEDEFAYRFIGMVQAAGVNEVVGLFDMLDALPVRDKKYRLATKTIFESGVRKFHTKDYAVAVRRFEKVVNADPNDICAAVHLETARQHLKYPDLPSVFVFSKK